MAQTLKKLLAKVAKIYGDLMGYFVNVTTY